MQTLANIGHALVHLFVFLVVLAGLAVGGVDGVRWLVRDHDTGVVQTVTVAASKDASAAGARYDSDEGAQHAADIAQGARAQLTVDAKARQADQGQPVDLNANDIRSIWREPAHANP